MRDISAIAPSLQYPKRPGGAAARVREAMRGLDSSAAAAAAGGAAGGGGDASGGSSSSLRPVDFHVQRLLQDSMMDEGLVAQDLRWMPWL